MARTFAKLSIIVAASGIATTAHAQQFENLDRLDSIVAMSVGANIGEPGGAVAPVDRRLKLAACPQVPQMSGMMFGAAMIECKAQGWRIRVPLNPGGQQPLAVMQQASYGRPAAIQKQVVVKKGDPVQLIAGGSAFMVTRMMIADEDGAAGDMIRVREDKKSDPVMARVQESGIVKAAGFKDF